MSKIKEKTPVGKQLKEKVQAAPKELLRRGLSDGTQRLQSQLRDVTQQGQRDGYGGDQVEDTTLAGGRQAGRSIEKLLKQKKGSKTRGNTDRSSMSPPEPSMDAQPWDEPVPPAPPRTSVPQGTMERVKIKTRDSMRQPHTDTSVPRAESPAQFESPSLEKSPERVRIKTRETVPRSGLTERPQFEGSQIKQRSNFFRSRSAAPAPTADTPESFELPFFDRQRIRGQENVSQIFNRTKSGTGDTVPGTEKLPPSVPRPASQHDRPVIKTKSAFIQQRASEAAEHPPQVLDQRRELFSSKKAQKLAENRIGGQRSAAETFSVPQVDQDDSFVSLPSFGQQPAQKKETSNFVVPRAKSSPKSEPISSRKMAVKTAHPDEIVHTSTKIIGRPVGRSAKKAERTSTQIIKSKAHGSKIVERTTQAVPQARRRAMQAVRATKKAATVTTRNAAKAGTAALRATVRAARTLTAALAAGSSVVIAVVLIICMVGLITASPFGIFFSDSNGPDVASPTAAVAQINQEYADTLSGLQAGGSYDSVKIIGAPPSWSDVLAVFSVKTTTEDGSGVAVLDEDNLERLRTVFWDMTKITTEEETVDHPVSGNTPAWSETVLTITVTPRTPDDMRVFYSFTDTQNQMLDGLLANGEMLVTLAGDLSITSQDARALLAALPNGLSRERREVVETACRLVGKVNYFWGGKSRVLGWDERWGQMKKVTASGSSTSGTYRPFGLDCSGFVDWVFYNVSGGGYIIGHGGGAHSQHTYCTAITWDQAIPGDLVFYPGDTHVGIVGGRDENGNLLIIHCASSANNVVITGKSGFTSIARPNYYSK